MRLLRRQQAIRLRGTRQFNQIRRAVLLTGPRQQEYIRQFPTLTGLHYTALPEGFDIASHTGWSYRTLDELLHNWEVIP